jgi:hypothetical protein
MSFAEEQPPIQYDPSAERIALYEKFDELFRAADNSGALEVVWRRDGDIIYVCGGTWTCTHDDGTTHGAPLQIFKTITDGVANFGFRVDGGDEGLDIRYHIQAQRNMLDIPTDRMQTLKDVYARWFLERTDFTQEATQAYVTQWLANETAQTGGRPEPPAALVERLVLEDRSLWNYIVYGSYLLRMRDGLIPREAIE